MSQEVICIGGPLDGKAIVPAARFIEAITDDFSQIARYEVREKEAVLLGYVDHPRFEE